jgi:hypothetical protein
MKDPKNNINSARNIRPTLGLRRMASMGLILRYFPCLAGKGVSVFVDYINIFLSNAP